MAKWSEYKSKETPASEDELMSYDIAGKANKRITIDKVANNTTFSEMKTKNKTLVGGINEASDKVASLKEEMANVKSITDAIDERILEAFFGSMRNGKVYQTEVYLTETNPTSDGVKTLANANMVCEPSTDTVEGRDDYEGIGIFNWYKCNYITDDYGRKIPTAIEGWETVIRMMDLLTLVLLQ